MKMMISPAKKMKRPEWPAPRTNPLLLERTLALADGLRKADRASLKEAFGCSDRLFSEAMRMLKGFELPDRQHYPALLSYDGIQYTYMAADVFTDAEYLYLEDRLRIISAMYGILGPMDAVMPYRLEMQTILPDPLPRTLYRYWGASIAKEMEDDLVIDLASSEYSKAVLPHLPSTTKVVKPVFAEIVGNRPKEKGVYVKMARGAMVRFLAENRIEKAEDIKAFTFLGFRYSKELSTPSLFLFAR